MSRLQSRRRRFLYYSVYAWGGPLLITLLTITVQFLPLHLKQATLLPDPGTAPPLFPTQHFVSAGHGQRSCFFKDYIARMAYFHIPVMILLTLNVVFFSLASWALVFGVWNSANDKIRRPFTQRFKIIVWLFFGMGLPWVGDSVTGAIGHTDHPLVFILDIINALNGLIIFLIFIIKKSVINSVKKFIRNLPCSDSVATAGSTRSILSSRLSSSLVKGKTTRSINNANSKSEISSNLSAT